MKFKEEITRRTFLTHALGLCITSGLSACTSIERTNSNKQVNIYNWTDYISPKTINDFEKKYGIKVVYDTVSSNEGLLAKFQAGASNYDVIVPTGYMVKQMHKLGLLRELDKDQLPNLKNIAKRFQSSSYDPKQQYSVPYTFGTTGIAYNQTVLEDLDIKNINNWDIFWNPKLKARITLLDDPRETIGLSLKRNGYSYNTVDHNIINQACNNLVKQKELVMCYTSDQVIIYLASGDSLLSLAFNGDAYQATRQNSDIKYVIPENGTSMWTDNLCIPKAAPHPENAHLWLNFMMEPEIAAQNANYTWYATPNEAALPFIKPEMLAQKGLYPSPEILDKCEEITDISDALFYYNDKWTELKCA